jgi:hypothetical protein
MRAGEQPDSRHCCAWRPPNLYKRESKMFSYLLILFELSILLFAYWFVYMQKPSSYKVDKDVWGMYPGAHLKPTGNMRLTFSNQFPNGIKTEEIRLEKN